MSRRFYDLMKLNSPFYNSRIIFFRFELTESGTIFSIYDLDEFVVESRSCLCHCQTYYRRMKFWNFANKISRDAIIVKFVEAGSDLYWARSRARLDHK